MDNLPPVRRRILTPPIKKPHFNSKHCLWPVATTPSTMSTPWWFFLIAAGLIVMSGFFSGLNLGLMSLAPDELKVVMEGSADEQAKKDAAKIYPLRKRGNLLLCTLLLGNTLVNALIAVLLADATDGVIGSLLTTALILIFGEIIPQSICSRYGLRTGAVALPFVYLFVGLCFVVCYPLSKILDWALGREITAVYTKNELKALLRMNLEDPARRGDFDEEDGRILAGALQLSGDLAVLCGLRRVPAGSCGLTSVEKTRRTPGQRPSIPPRRRFQRELPHQRGSYRRAVET